MTTVAGAAEALRHPGPSRPKSCTNAPRGRPWSSGYPCTAAGREWPHQHWWWLVSGEVVTWAMYQAPMLLTKAGKPDSTARFVLAVLGEAAHKGGTGSFPSVERIRFATGFDCRVIKRALDRLHEAGLIEEDGSQHGQTRWKLAVSLQRPDADKAVLKSEKESRRRAEAEYRRQYRRGERRRPTAAVSGTQNPGQEVIDEAVSGTQSTGHEAPEAGSVRDAESRSPGRKVPVSGTQNPGPIDKEGTVLGTVPEPSTGGRAATPQTPAASIPGLGSVGGSPTAQADLETCAPYACEPPREEQPTVHRRLGQCAHGKSLGNLPNGLPDCSRCRRLGSPAPGPQLRVVGGDE